MPTPPFSPSPEDFTLIINQLADPYTSFSDLADSHNTTVEALSLFLARPDIQDRINNLHAALAARVRLISTNHLIAASGALKLIVDGYSHEERNVLVNPRSLQALEQRRRSRETARRAASLLSRLSRFQHTPLIFRAPVERAPVTRPSRTGTPTLLTKENPGTQSLGPAPLTAESAASDSAPPFPDEPEARARQTASDFQPAPGVPESSPPFSNDTPSSNLKSPVSNLKFEISNSSSPTHGPAP